MADLNDFNLPVMTSLFADVIDTLRENIKRVKAGAVPIGGGTITGDLIVNGNTTTTGNITGGTVTSNGVMTVKAPGAGDAVLRFVDDANVEQGKLTWRRSDDTMVLSGTTNVQVASPLSITGKVTGADADFSGYLRATGTGAFKLPSGTTAQRPAGALGDLRYNSSLGVLEAFKASGWGPVGGGPSLGTDSIIRTNAKVIAENINFTGNENGSTVGTVTINDGFTVNVVTGSRWAIL